jgi:STE24 endopeptidase
MSRYRTPWLLVAGILLTLALTVVPGFSMLLQPKPTGNTYFAAAEMVKGWGISRESAVINTVTSLLSLSVLLYLVFGRGGAVLVHRIEKRAGGHKRAVALILLLYMALDTVLTIPFSYYVGFVREHRLGLSTQSLGSWLQDYFLNFAISFLSNLVVLVLVLWLARRFPRRWWIIAGVILSVLTVVMVVVYPIVIDPLFVKREPMTNPQVLDMANRLASRAGVKLDSVWLEKASLKTNRVNAMVTGIGPTKRIVVWDTLINNYPPDLVESVVAHELGHAVYRDVLWGALLYCVGTFAACAMLARLLRPRQRVGEITVTEQMPARVILVILLAFAVLSGLANPVANTFSRFLEARADQFAMNVTDSPDALIQLQTRFGKDMPHDVDPPAVYEFLMFTHPSTMNRIRAGEAWKQEHGQ